MQQRPADVAPAAPAPDTGAASSLTPRLVLGVALVVLGFVVHAGLMSVFIGGGIEYAHDFKAYFYAAGRWLDGASLYGDAQLSAPTDPVCLHCYRYPPLFAQLLAPIARLPEQAAMAIWHGLQLFFMFSAVWIATGIGGARRSLERGVWSLVAVLWFAPVFWSLWDGNISTLLALSGSMLALGGAAAGFGAAVVALIKFVPGTLVPAALVMDRRSAVTVLAVLLGVAALSFVLAPSAWFEFPTVLLNLLRGNVDYRYNFAPAYLTHTAGLPDALAQVVRLVTFAVAAGAVVLSMWAARRVDGRPMAALLGMVALLLLPGALWFHYLCVLLPFAAMVWSGAGHATRAALLAASVVVTVGALEPRVALLGALLLVLICGWSLWPREPVTAEPVEQALAS